MSEPKPVGLRPYRTISAVLCLLLPACSGSDDSPGGTLLGGAASSGGESGLHSGVAFGGKNSLGGSSGTPDTLATGGAVAAGGTSSIAGASSGTGGRTTAGSLDSGGTAAALGGASHSGGTYATGGATGIGGTKVSITGGTATSGGTKTTGSSSDTGGAATTVSNPGGGGTRATGGTKAFGGTKAAGGVSQTGGADGTGGAGGASGTGCPYTGHVTYTLSKSANPSATELNAYELIAAAMDKAVMYYNCYTNITKAINASYVPSVSTADGNINGSIRFGSNTSYMDYRTAMHEISHTVGVGTASKWSSCIDNTNKLYTCANAKQQLVTINGQLSNPSDGILHADTQHFWPYGINQQNEVKSEADLIYHCQMVMAILKDLT